MISEVGWTLSFALLALRRAKVWKFWSRFICMCVCWRRIRRVCSASLALETAALVGWRMQCGIGSPAVSRLSAYM